MARFESCGRWADLSDSHGGITMTSDVKAGFDIHGITMMMSLLKAPMQTDKWADFGIRRFIIRLDFHNQEFSPKSQILADQLNYPPTFCDIGKSQPVEKEFLKIEENKLILTCLKVSEDGKGFIARFVEPSGGFTTANVEFPLLEGDWKFDLVNMEEKNEIPLEYNKEKKSITLEAEMFQVLTVKFSKI